MLLQFGSNADSFKWRINSYSHLYYCTELQTSIHSPPGLSDWTIEYRNDKLFCFSINFNFQN